MNQGGETWVINSTLADNIAGTQGGALASEGGPLHVISSTLTDNDAPEGGALYAAGPLHLANSILANSTTGEDCVLSGDLDPASSHNIIETHRGCGGIFSSADPVLLPRKYYNGMTQSYPLGMASPAMNNGYNAGAVNQDGEALTWDQRGNGDPRFVAGFTDIGAFETQAFPRLEVDTFEDNGLRGCGGGRGDCPLRAALELVDANIERADTITFDPRVFTEAVTLELSRPLPVPSNRVTIDASMVPGLRLRVRDGQRALPSPVPGQLTIKGIELD